MVVKVRNVYCLVYYQVVLCGGLWIGVRNNSGNGAVLLGAKGRVVTLDQNWSWKV